jgi:hypothetical protein
VIAIVTLLLKGLSIYARSLNIEMHDKALKPKLGICDTVQQDDLQEDNEQLQISSPLESRTYTHLPTPQDGSHIKASSTGTTIRQIPIHFNNGWLRRRIRGSVITEGPNANPRRTMGREAISYWTRFEANFNSRAML